jgi:hypothetical protein
MLTVAARYNGSVQPPGARMILFRLRGTTSRSGRPSPFDDLRLDEQVDASLTRGLGLRDPSDAPSTRCTVTPDSPNNNVVPLLKPVASSARENPCTARVFGGAGDRDRTGMASLEG